MAFFPHVTKGDKFKPIALLENNVRDIVNMYNSPRGIPRRAYAPDIPVYNGSAAEIIAYRPIVLSHGKNDAKKALPANESSPAAEEILAIATCSIYPNRTGNAVIHGITKAQVNVIETTHRYAATTDAGTFVSCENPTAVMLLSRPDKTGIQIVDVNISQGQTMEEAASERIFRATVYSGDGSCGYTCSLVDLATGEDAGSGIVYPVQIAYNSTLPTGYVLIAHAYNTRLIEGD